MIQFSTDGASYSFSIADTLHACRFAIFSDQDKFVYMATPMMNARVGAADYEIDAIGALRHIRNRGLRSSVPRRARRR